MACESQLPGQLPSIPVITPTERVLRYDTPTPQFSWLTLVPQTATPFGYNPNATPTLEPSPTRDYAATLTPQVHTSGGTVQPSAEASDEVPPVSKEPEEGSEKKPYVNNNPGATEDEIRIGETLHEKAQSGELPGVKEVEGLAEVKGKPSPDYRLTLDDGSKMAGDLYQPETDNQNTIWETIVTKGRQAEVIIVELGERDRGRVTIEDAQDLAQSALKQTGKLTRVIIIKGGEIVVDVSR